MKEEFELSDELFEAFKNFIYDVSGIDLSKKKELLRARLIKRLRSLNMPFEDYFKYVKSNDTEIKNMLTVVSTNLTFFFREPAHFDFLKKEIVPKIFNCDNPYIRGWSAAASSGEEAYSILISILEAGVNLSYYDFKLLATDISSKVIETAGEGIYDYEKIAKISEELKKKYFLKSGSGKNVTVKIKDYIRKYVTFTFLNLMQDYYPFKKNFDFIFCRNVIIYFDKPTQESVIDKLYNYLKPGGYLFVGHSESLVGIKHHFKYVKPTIYKK